MGLRAQLKESESGTVPASWEICIQVKKQQLEPDMEQWTGSEFRQGTSRLYIFTLFI